MSRLKVVTFKDSGPALLNTVLLQNQISLKDHSAVYLRKGVDTGDLATGLIACESFH